MSVEYDKIFIVEKPSFSDYVIDGNADPEITLVRGETYLFDFTTDGHPFYIKSSLGTGTAGQYDSGVINQGSSSANQDLIFTVPDDAPDTLYYQCSAHYQMNGVIRIVDPLTKDSSNDSRFIGNEFLVNTTTINNEYSPSITKLQNGNYIVLWSSSGEATGYKTQIYGQLFNSVDEKIGDELIIDFDTSHNHFTPTVTGYSDGSFLVVWAQDGDYLGSQEVLYGSYIYGQTFSANGEALTDVIRFDPVSTNEYSKSKPIAISLSDDSTVIFWGSYEQDGDGSGVFGYRFGIGGYIAQELEVNANTIGHQALRDAVKLSDGSVVVVWESFGQDGIDVYFEKFYGGVGTVLDNQGAIDYFDKQFVSSGEFSPNINTNGGLAQPSVTALSNGEFLVTWINQIDDDYAIYGQVFDNSRSPNKIGDEFLIAESADMAAATALSDGGFFITWTQYFEDDNADIYGQQFDQQAIPVGDAFIINSFTDGRQRANDVIEVSSENLSVVWISPEQDGASNGIYSQLLDPVETTPKHNIFTSFKNHVLSIFDDSSATPVSATTDADLTGYTLVFEDTFDSIGFGPNTDNWTFDLGNDGWGNGEAQDYQSGLDDAQIIDWDVSSEINGALRITAKNVGGTITSARVKSDIDIGPYGYYEVRAKLPSEDGAWPAIWLLGEGGRTNWPNDGEIDLVEWSSAYATADTQIISALHYPAAHGGSANDTTTNLPTPVDDWHTYQLWWTPDAIKIGVDGTEADAHLVYSKPNNATNHAWPYDGPMDMILNIAIGGTLGGTVPSSNFEYTMDVDYVRIYQMEDLDASEVSSKLTITYESNDYSGYIHNDFEGNNSIVLSASDAPQFSGGAVLQITKTTGASEIAGTVLFDLLGNGELINADSSVVSMDVLSPSDNVKVRLKLEDSTDQNIFVELDAYTELNGSNTWETLTWDLSTANGLDHNNSYDKAVVFFDFGNLGDNSQYYIDNVLFNGYTA